MLNPGQMLVYMFTTELGLCMASAQFPSHQSKVSDLTLKQLIDYMDVQSLYRLSCVDSVERRQVTLPMNTPSLVEDYARPGSNAVVIHVVRRKVFVASRSIHRRAPSDGRGRLTCNFNELLRSSSTGTNILA